jgi:hypothetical protein
LTAGFRGPKTWSMKIAGTVLCAALGVVLAPAAAQAANKEWDGGYSLKASRRSGFVASVQVGYGLAHIAGYPNEVSKIDDPAYRSSTGGTVGSTLTLWLGGALRDWFTFGLGLMTLGASKDEMKAGGGAFIVHVEAFPLWSKGGRYRDLSAYANFGAGSLGITGVPNEVDGGLVSVLGGGIGYELLRSSHFAFGPMLESTYMYSQSAQAYGIFAGVRGSLRGGP